VEEIGELCTMYEAKVHIIFGLKRILIKFSERANSSRRCVGTSWLYRVDLEACPGGEGDAGRRARATLELAN
jgi:hypothetical protein